MRLEDLLLDPEYCKESFCIVDKNGKWDHDKLVRRVARMTNYLIEDSVKENENIGILLDNGAEYFVAVISIMAAGACVVPLYIQMPPASLEEIMNRCGICRVITSVSKRNLIKNTARICITEENIPEDVVIKPKLSFISKSEESRAFLLMTSGTTGVPKLVELSHKSILNNIDSILNYLKLTANDSIYIAKAMQYSATMVGEVLTGLRVGCCLYILDNLVPPQIILQRIAHLRPTFLGTTPSLLRQLLRRAEKYDLSSIRLLSISGSTVDEQLLQEAEHYFTSAEILNVYGMTEAGPRVAARSPSEKRVSNSVGKPISGVEIEIRHKDGRICAPTEHGEIWIKTRSLMNGYYQQDELTQEKIVNGWLRSGDLGYLDRDGNLFVLGRIDDVIIRNAQKIDPVRVENCVRQMESVADSVVFGAPDSSCSNKIVCIIVAKNGYSPTQEDVINHCRKNLAPYECPMEVHIWDKIPITPYGKISRKKILEEYLKAGSN